jgi:hypothetical protein
MTDSDSSPSGLDDIHQQHKRLSGGKRRSSGGASAGRKLENPFQTSHEMIR